MPVNSVLPQRIYDLVTFSSNSNSNSIGVCHRLQLSEYEFRLRGGGFSYLCSTKNFGSVQRRRVEIHATGAETNQPKWWEKNCGPNMIDIHSTEEFLDALKLAEDRLVIVEFFGTWCASCRALFPKICRIAEQHPEIIFLKVNFDENKPLCKSLNVRVLPFFHFYRGADGLLDSFSCSLARLQKLKDAITVHSKVRPLDNISDASEAFTQDKTYC